MKIKKLTSFLLAALMILAMAGCRNRIPQVKDFADDYVDALPENAEDGLTLHAFNWTYREIMINLENIRNAGFKNVLTMPVQEPKSGGSAWERSRRDTDGFSRGPRI